MKQKLKSRGLGIPVSLERGGCQLNLLTFISQLELLYIAILNQLLTNCKVKLPLANDFIRLRRVKSIRIAIAILNHLLLFAKCKLPLANGFTRPR
jgi:hypothetical protein